MKHLIFIASILIPLALFANGSEHGAEGAHHEAGVPGFVFWQFVNLAILFGALIYFLRAPAKRFFIERKAAYVASANKSQAAKDEAEKSFLDIKHRLDQLEANKDESIARAHAEAAELRNSIIAEAHALSKKIKDETEATAKLELVKAKAELRSQLIHESMQIAQKTLKADTGASDQLRLQNEFVDKVGAVKA